MSTASTINHCITAELTLDHPVEVTLASLELSKSVVKINSGKSTLPETIAIRSFQSSSLACQTCCRTKRHEMKHAVSLREYLCLTEYFIREQTLWQTACVVPQMISCQEDLCFLLVEIGIIYLSAYYPVNIYISLMFARITQFGRRNVASRLPLRLLRFASPSRSIETRVAALAQGEDNPI